MLNEETTQLFFEVEEEIAHAVNLAAVDLLTQRQLPEREELIRHIGHTLAARGQASSCLRPAFDGVPLNVHSEELLDGVASDLTLAFNLAAENFKRCQLRGKEVLTQQQDTQDIDSQFS